MQYTVRNIPDYLDSALRRAARQQGKSLNEMAVLALVRGAGLSETVRRKRDLADLTGSWREDPAFVQALAAQDIIDESMWPNHPAARKPAPQKRVGKKTAASTSQRKKPSRAGTAA